MDEVAIKVDHVSKTFRLPHERAGSVKNMLVNFARRKKGYEIQQVLKDVSFEIKKGEFFGIVGRNGSGKSTLLKMLAGIYTPSSGSIQVNGKLTPFIELGVGFNPDLTGRENVFLNGALLGFNRKDMEAMYDDIVEFAELERFMDQKLKNYSSGMQVRLAFSIAIRAETDILVLDEVLAVGDEAFQRKCNDYFEKQKGAKQTIVLVTHDMQSVQKYCTRAMLINDGEIVEIGDPDLVSEKYTKLNMVGDSTRPTKSKSDKIEVVYRNDKGEPAHTFIVGETIEVHINWRQPETSGIGVVLYKQTGERIFAANTILEKILLKGTGCIYRIVLNVAQGDYYLRVRTYGEDGKNTTGIIERTPTITVKARENEVDGLVPLEHSWRVE